MPNWQLILGETGVLWVSSACLLLPAGPEYCTEILQGISVPWEFTSARVCWGSPKSDARGVVGTRALAGPRVSTTGAGQRFKCKAQCPLSSASLDAVLVWACSN